MGNITYFLGFSGDDGTFYSQTKYIKNILKKFDMEGAKAINTPMSSTIQLDKEVS